MVKIWKICFIIIWHTFTYFHEKKNPYKSLHLKQSRRLKCPKFKNPILSREKHSITVAFQAFRIGYYLLCVPMHMGR